MPASAAEEPIAIPPKPNDRSPVKKKKKSLQTTLVPAVKSSVQLNEALKGKYVGKRILLTAAFLYGRRIPVGEENLLFQYHVASVNDDNKTAHHQCPSRIHQLS